jgi:ubiquinone/menaquinone biosynthesis C-methylase UbiE
MLRYDATAHLYDMRYDQEQTAKIEAALKEVTVKENCSVLDVGCGTGILFQHVSTRTRNIVGLDISRKTLSLARERARRFINVHLILADADNIPLRNGAFDYVFAITLIQNAPNPIRTLNEIRRVSRLDCVFAITGLKKCFFRESFQVALKKAGFRILKLMDEYDLKCYVAVCTRLIH